MGRPVASDDEPAVQVDGLLGSGVLNCSHGLGPSGRCPRPSSFPPIRWPLPGVAGQRTPKSTHQRCMSPDSTRTTSGAPADQHEHESMICSARNAATLSILMVTSCRCGRLRCLARWWAGRMVSYSSAARLRSGSWVSRACQSGHQRCRGGPDDLDPRDVPGTAAGRPDGTEEWWKDGERVDPPTGSHL